MTKRNRINTGILALLSIVVIVGCILIMQNWITEADRENLIVRSIGYLLSGFSFLMISLTLVYISSRRKDLHGHIYLLIVGVIMFLFAASAGHIIDFLNLKLDEPIIASVWHMVAGVIAFVTAIHLFRYKSLLIEFPSIADLEQMIRSNKRLREDLKELRGLYEDEVRTSILREKEDIGSHREDDIINFLDMEDTEKE